MTAPHYAGSDAAGHRWYTLPSGERFLSVTTIIGAASDKPDLLWWSAGMAADRASEHPYVLTADLTDAQRGDVRKWLASAADDYRAYTSDLGTRVHNYAEADILGIAPPVGMLPKDERPYATQWLKFRADHNPLFTAAEMTVINRKVGYAGTLDGVMQLDCDALPAVVDWKSGKHGPYTSWAHQLAALANGETVLLPDGSEYPMSAVNLDLGYSLRIKPRSYHVIPVDLTGLFAEFKAMAFLAQRNYIDRAGGVTPFGDSLPKPLKAAS